MPKSNAEIEQAVRSVVGSMALSDITLTEEQIENCRAIMRGELDGETHVQEIITKYRKQNGVPDPDSAGEDSGG